MQSLLQTHQHLDPYKNKYNFKKIKFKRIVSVILNNLSCKHANVPFTSIPLKPLSDRNCGKYCRFSVIEFNSDNSFLIVIKEKPQLKIISYKNYKHWYLIHIDHVHQMLRLLLWIGYCHLCKDGRLKLRLQSPSWL